MFKKTKYFIILVSALFLTSCSSDRNVNTVSRLEAIYVQKAYEFAKSQFESCQTNFFIPITDEIATPWLVRNLTVEDMKISCAEINQKYGNLIDLKIEQTLLYKKRYIYRFKAKYSKNENYSEIRVYSEQNHKFSGLIFKQTWNDKYTHFKP